MSGSTMSSETSISRRPTPVNTPDPLKPWQFFVLAALGCATAVTFLVRSQGTIAVILVILIMAATGLVGLGVLRTIRPLVSTPDDRAVMLGQRTRAGLEQEKALALRTIKELEFDRAMGKLSDGDFQEMSVRLRARAARLIKRLDAGDGYRPQIEREIARRLGQMPGQTPDAAPATKICSACSTVNDRDARFCKECGTRL